MEWEIDFANNKNIVVKPIDKRIAFVVQDKNQSVMEILRQLSDNVCVTTLASTAKTWLHNSLPRMLLFVYQLW